MNKSKLSAEAMSRMANLNIEKRNMGQYLGIYRFNLGRKNKIPSLKPKRSFIDRIKLKYNLSAIFTSTILLFMIFYSL